LIQNTFFEGELKMLKLFSAKWVLISGVASWLLFSAGCAGTATNSNVNLVNQNANLSNTFNSNTNMNAINANTTSSTSGVETKEPDQYQATVTLKLEAVGDQQKTALPTIATNVARMGTDRRMEFNLPNGEKVVYIDKAGMNYLILPNRKQYAELTKESLGFEVRQMLMPEQIVNRVQNTRGVEKVGEETVGGRTVVKYRYGAVTNTQTQAGQVATESFLLVDKETGLPLRSETVSESQAQYQGYKQIRFVTEMTNINANATPDLFTLPPDYQKIDAEQVKAQVNLVFNVVGQFISQMMKTSTQPTANTNANTNANANTGAR